MSPRLKKQVLCLTVVLMLALMSGCQGTAGTPNNNPEPQPPVDRDKNGPPTGDHNNPDGENDGKGRESESARLLQQIRQLAAAGKVPGCDYAVKTNCIEDVEQEWGKPVQADYVAEAKGSFASYPNHDVVFGFNKGAQIFDIRSYDKQLKAIRLSDLKKLYGKPDLSRSYKGEDIIGYVVSEEFKIRFVFPAANKQNPDPQLDHISVFYPRGTVNEMADDPGVEW